MSSGISISIAGQTFTARPLGDLALGASILSALADKDIHLVQDQWSGGLLKSLEADLAPELTTPADAATYSYQYLGLIGFEPVERRLAVAYGDAKSQVAEALRPVIPIAVVEQELDLLKETGNALQFEGAASIDISTDAGDPPRGARVEADFTVSLGGVRARAAFLPDADPELVRSFRSRLPLAGTATNTHSGGPLTRFWNEVGGVEGETPLDHGDAAARSQVLRPGHMYYLPTRPWRGFRLALREPTIMRSAVGGGASRLAPLAVLLDHRAELARVAADLPVTGRVPLRFDIVTPTVPLPQTYCIGGLES